MAKETEIKLRASPETLAALRSHTLLETRRQSERKTGTLFNQYYDTAARDLAGARVALRMRRDGEQCIQSYLAGNTETELSAPHRVVSSDDLIKVKCEGNEELSFDK